MVLWIGWSHRLIYLVPRSKVIFRKMDNRKSAVSKVSISPRMISGITRFIPCVVRLTVCFKRQVVRSNIRIHPVSSKFCLSLKSKIDSVKHPIKRLLQFCWRTRAIVSCALTSFNREKMFLSFKAQLFARFSGNWMPLTRFAYGSTVRSRPFATTMSTTKGGAMFGRKFNALMCFANMLTSFRRLYTCFTNIRLADTTPRMSFTAGF